MAKFLSLNHISLKFGLPPEEISEEEYREKAQQRWVEWVPEVSEAEYGHSMVAITPPDTSHLQELVSHLCDRKMTLG